MLSEVKFVSMYKRFAIQLFLCNLLIGTAWFSLQGIRTNHMTAKPAFQLRLTDNAVEPRADKHVGFVRQASSGQRVVDYEVLEKNNRYGMSNEDYEVLLRIVQAEAGCEDEKGKMLVAGVVMNRVENKRFPDSVTEVVFQNVDGKYQFSPIANGTYYSVAVTEETVAAVDKVLEGEDVTQGALYFVAREFADEENVEWFDASLEKLFCHGGHEFFK